jgi:hypothetical protein
MAGALAPVTCLESGASLPSASLDTIWLRAKEGPHNPFCGAVMLVPLPMCAEWGKVQASQSFVKMTTVARAM